MANNDKLTHIGPDQLKEVIINLCEKVKGIFVTKAEFRSKVNQIHTTTEEFESRITHLEDVIARLEEVVEIKYEDETTHEEEP